MPKVSGSAFWLRRAATTRASARAETMGSVEVAGGCIGERGVERGRHGDRIAIEAEIERRQDRHLDVPDAEAGGDRNGRKQMRGIEQADIELVPHVRPRHLAHELDVQPLGRRKALVDRDDRRGRVGERNEAHPQPHVAGAHFNSSAAVTTDWATSAIFLFSFIAVLRNSA